MVSEFNTCLNLDKYQNLSYKEPFSLNDLMNGEQIITNRSGNSKLTKLFLIILSKNQGEEFIIISQPFLPLRVLLKTRIYGYQQFLNVLESKSLSHFTKFIK